MTNNQENRLTALLFVGAAAAIGCGSSAESQQASDGSTTLSGGASGTGGVSATGDDAAGFSGDSAGHSGGGGAGNTGNDGSAGPSGGGAAGNTGNDGSAAQGACNTLVNIGTDVPWTSDPAPVPTMTGGMIVDGTYVLTSSINYGGISAPSANAKSKFTIVIAGITTQFVASYNGGPDVHSTAQGTPSGIQLNSVQTCPVGGMTDGTYTATPTSLTVRPLRDAAHEDYHVVIFTKQ